MYLKALRLLALGAIAVDAFRDASPFFYYSTADQLHGFDALRSASSLTTSISDHLSRCATDFYVLVSQPGVQSSDYQDGRVAPGLTKGMRSSSVVKSTYSVNEVVGDIDSEALRRLLEEECGAMRIAVDASTGAFPVIGDSKPRVISIDFQAPTTKPRSQSLLENDGFLSSLIDFLPTDSYTVVYTTQPSSTETHESDSLPYEMEDPYRSSFQMELKRDLSLHGELHKRQRANDTLPDGPLFERYGFLSPGVFMGLLAGIILHFILYVGLSALSSLQVSYAAFDKEMGPTAQKKQQ